MILPQTQALKKYVIYLIMRELLEEGLKLFMYMYLIKNILKLQHFVVILVKKTMKKNLKKIKEWLKETMFLEL